MSPVSVADLSVALKQLDQLQRELIKTEKILKGVVKGLVTHEAGILFGALIRSPIPNLVTEIGYIMEISDFKVESMATSGDELEISPVDIKEEVIVGEASDEESFQSFEITPENSQEANEPEMLRISNKIKMETDSENSLNYEDSKPNKVQLRLKIRNPKRHKQVPRPPCPSCGDILEGLTPKQAYDHKQRHKPLRCKICGIRIGCGQKSVLARHIKKFH